VAGDCLFCAIAAGAERSHVVFDEPDVVAFLDHRPVFKGHVLVIPRVHVVTLPELPHELLAPLFGAVSRCCTAVVSALGAQGSWVAENNIVSQAVPHLHVHVVPRTKGDGLRGFFWPRVKYEGEEEMADYATRLRAALSAG
jgi:histidine triad (HIT) family protein